MSFRSPKLIIAAMLASSHAVESANNSTLGSGDDSITLQLVNGYSTTKTVYFRYSSGSGLTDRGAPVPPKDSHTMNIPASSSVDLKLAAGGSVISAIAWMDSSDCRTWNKGAGGGTDKGGPQCSQHELTINSKVLSYDISAVEGVCGSYSIVWHPYDGQKPSGSDLSMSPPTRSGYGQCVPADKNDHKKWSGQDIQLAGCPWGDGPHKVQCHKWIESHSYVEGGYCRWLYDSNSQAYCWAYDEMMCPLGRTCTYNADGNPQIDGHGAYKKVNGAPTNPNVPRKGGKLVMSFLPLGSSTQEIQV